MFIYQPEILSEVQERLNVIKEKFGILPPHWELLAAINPVRFEMFITEIYYLQNHLHIAPDFFAFLRLFVATKEGFSYCKSFNTKLLIARGYTKNTIKSITTDMTCIPFDEKHQHLADKVIKALYKPEEFGLEDIVSLKELSWTDADIYDAIDHGAFLFKFSKILKAYGA